jgi:hypothetical protein
MQDDSAATALSGHEVAALYRRVHRSFTEAADFADFGNRKCGWGCHGMALSRAVVVSR